MTRRKVVMIWKMLHKFLNEDDESDMVKKKTKSERCWRLRGNRKDKTFRRRNCVEVLDDRQNQQQTLQNRSFAQKLRS